MLDTKKELGQHWLTDERVLSNIADSANLCEGDNVLEIGPGLGTLTQVLLDRGAKIRAIEFDKKLASSLKNRVLDKDDSLIVENEDIRKYNFSSLPSGYKIVANIPYYLTSWLIGSLCDITNKPAVIVLLVQKEVAQRIAANPGEMSAISVITQMNYIPSLGEIVPAKLFTPPPKIDSQILILQRRQAPLFDGLIPKRIYGLVRVGFAERRKKLRSSISSGLGINKEESEKLLRSAGIDPNLRAQNLSLQDWINLSKAISLNKA